jgi:hypothetical protein
MLEVVTLTAAVYVLPVSHAASSDGFHGGIMSTTESPGTGADQVRDTERPEGTVDEDANPPLTDPTKPDRNTEEIPPQDTGRAVPPYEGRT